MRLRLSIPAAALACGLTLLSLGVQAQSGCSNAVAIYPAATLRFGSAAQQFVVDVSPNGAGFSCAWYSGTTSDSDWLSGPVTYFAPGGDGLFGEIRIAVTENTTGAARTGHIELAQQAGSITVVQEPGACVGVQPSLAIPRTGGAMSVPIQASAPDCAWAITGYTRFFDWFELTVSGGRPGDFRSQGLGSRTLTVTAQSNANGTGARSRDLSIGGVTLQLNQEPPLCVFALAPATVTVPAGGASGSLSLTGTGTDCSYTAATSGQLPITITGGSSGTAPATIQWSVVASTDNQSRTGVLTVGGAAVPFTQGEPAIVTDTNFNGVGLALWRAGDGTVVPTPAEAVRLVNGVTPAGGWSATADQSWVTVSPGAGVSPATLRIGFDPAAVSGFPLGVHRARVAVASASAAEGTRYVNVALFVADGSNSQPPRTKIEFVPGLGGTTPASGAVPLTGWALSDIGINRIEIWRNFVAGEPAGTEVFIGHAVRVRGARPDVAIIRAGTFPNSVPYPGAASAGWGYMLLSNALPGGGNAAFTFHFDLIDLAGRRTRMGSVPLTFNNVAATKPFGTIDSPAQGETVSGTIVNRGWVLTPPGKSIPLDGSTIKVYIDGVLRAPVSSYDHPRPDVKALFPGLANSNGPEARLSIDTTSLSDGTHTIAWGVIDDAGAAEGIGSRHFTVQNGSSSLVSAPEEVSRAAKTVTKLPVLQTDVWSREGVEETAWATRVDVDAKGTRTLRVPQGQRVELFLDPTLAAPCGTYEGFMLNGEVAGPLPVGASLDAPRGIFRWQPPAAFAGTFEFVFVQRGCDAVERRIPLKVIVGTR